MITANSLLSLKRKECAKYLCVLINSKLSWTHHITYISTKISKTLSILARRRYSVFLLPPYETYIVLLYNLTWPMVYSLLGPSCSYKFGENFESSKTCPSIDSFQTL